MLEKKIADQIRNHEVDPLDAGLFEKIMQERSKRNSKTGYLLIGSIALLFTLITGLGLSSHWGKIPQDGYSKADIEAIRKNEAQRNNSLAVDNNDEANAAIENTINDISNNNAVAAEANISNEDLTSFSSNTASIVSNANSSKSTKGTSIKGAKNTINNALSNTKINKPKSKNVTSTPTEPINTHSLLIDTSSGKLKSSPVYTIGEQRLLKPLAFLAYNESDMAEPVDQTQVPDASKDDKDDKGSNNKLFAYWPREINFFAGSYYNQRFINDGGSAIGQKIDGLEKVTSTYFIGLNAEYRVKKSIFGQIGVQWLTVNNTIHHHWSETVTHRTETVIDPGGQSYTIDVYDTSQTHHAGGTNSNNYFEIPLTVGARWQIKRHIIQPQFGFISSFYNNAKGTAFNDQGELQPLNGKKDMLRNVNIQAITGFTYTYLVGSRIGLYVQPNLRYGLTNQVKNSAPFSQYNSMVGGQFGLKYILK